MVSILKWPIGNVATEIGKVERFRELTKGDFKWEIVNIKILVKPLLTFVRNGNILSVPISNWLA
jgi:hypothetical protein